MTGLPVCSWRQPGNGPDSVRCTSQLVMSSGREIPSSSCVGCSLADHKPLTQETLAKLKHPHLQNPVQVVTGVGTELKLLLRQTGLLTTGDCACERRAAAMNTWGVNGCKKYRDRIVNWLRKEQEKRSWIETIKAASLAVTSGLAFKLNPLDPAPGLLDEAIRRAEAKINNAQEHKPPENLTAGAAEGDHA